MKNTLARFAELPGEPRLVFLSEGEEQAPSFKRVMELALQDKSLSQTKLEILLTTKASFISHNIDLGKLKLSDERRKALQTFLKESEK